MLSIEHFLVSLITKCFNLSIYFVVNEKFSTSLSSSFPSAGAYMRLIFFLVSRYSNLTSKYLGSPRKWHLCVKLCSCSTTWSFQPSMKFELGRSQRPQNSASYPLHLRFTTLCSPSRRYTGHYQKIVSGLGAKTSAALRCRRQVFSF